MPMVIVKSDKRAREKPCLRCGYSLRRIDALHCPECGLSVWRSLNQNDALDWSHPEWLRKLALACFALAAVQAVGVATYVLVNFIFLGPLYKLNWLLGAWVRAMRFEPFAVAAYAVALAAGLLLLSSHEGRYPDKWRGYRWGCRAAAGLAGLLALWSVTVGYTMRRRLVISHAWPVNLVLIAGVVATLAYLRKLAQRDPHPRLARLSGWLLLLPAVSLLKATPFFAAFLAFDFAGIAFHYLPVLFLPASVVLLIWFGRVFRRAAVAAEKGWAEETAGHPSPQAA